MNVKRIFRSPLAWIVIAVIAIGLLIDFGQRLSSGYSEAPTSQVVAIINGNEPLAEVDPDRQGAGDPGQAQGRQPDRLQGGLGRQPGRRS